MTENEDTKSDVTVNNETVDDVEQVTSTVTVSKWSDQQWVNVTKTKTVTVSGTPVNSAPAKGVTSEVDDIPFIPVWAGVTSDDEDYYKIKDQESQNS